MRHRIDRHFSALLHFFQLLLPDGLCQSLYLDVVTMPFSVNCRFCARKFKTGAALTKHFNLYHDEESELGSATFQDSLGNPCEEPKVIALPDEDMEEYLIWMKVLLERINAALVPDHPGKDIVSGL